MINRIINFYKTKNKYKKIGTTINTIYIGKNINIGSYCTISKNVILGDNVEVNDFTYLNSSKYCITVESNVKIGKYCSIGPGVFIGAGNHDYNFVTTHPILFDRAIEKKLNIVRHIQKADGLKDKKAITEIGNDVWIGLNACIKRGIKIGNGAVIASGAIVVKDVPDYAIVGGNPAKVIKFRTSDDNIKFLKKSYNDAWWNWSKEEIINNIDCLYDFDKYIEYLKKK